MKVVAINGSPRKEGNTPILLKELTSKLEIEGIETETINIGGKKVHDCTACMKCLRIRTINVFLIMTASTSVS